MLLTIEAPSNVAEGMVAGSDLIADCYFRWHLKLMQNEALFDPSWDCESTRLQDRLRWADRLFNASGRRLPQDPLFARVIERLILLKPIDVQRLSCAMSLLARRDDLRRCIDGPTVRTLQAMVGTAALAAILRSQRIPQSGPAAADLSVRTLVAQGFSRLTHVYDGHWSMALQYLRLAFPADMPTVPCIEDASQFERMLREAHAWYPETTWLYG